MNWIAALGCVVAVLARRPAQAESSLSATPGTPAVAVLGIESSEGDDVVAQRLSLLLRLSASRGQGWRILPSRASWTQMALVDDCKDKSETACLRRIASSLQASHLLFGSMRRLDAQHPEEFLLTLALFERRRGQKLRVLEQHVTQRQIALTHGMRPRVAAWIDYLAGSRGGLRVQAPSDAVVIIDGKKRGAIAASEGMLELYNLTPGTRRIEVQLAGQAPFRVEAPIVGGQVHEVNVEFGKPAQRHQSEAASGDSAAAAQPLQRRRLRLALGWSAVAAGGVFLSLSIWSFVRVAQLNDDSGLQAYRLRAPSTVQDVCDDLQLYAPPGDAALEDLDEARAVCRQVQRHEVLRWVFLSLGLAATTAGVLTLTLLGRRHARASSPTKTLSLLPSGGRRGVGLTAALRF